jgi:hypothetical protein
MHWLVQSADGWLLAISSRPPWRPVLYDRLALFLASCLGVGECSGCAMFTCRPSHPDRQGLEITGSSKNQACSAGEIGLQSVPSIPTRDFELSAMKSTTQERLCCAAEAFLDTPCGMLTMLAVAVGCPFGLLYSLGRWLSYTELVFLEGDAAGNLRVSPPRRSPFLCR